MLHLMLLGVVLVQENPPAVDSTVWQIPSCEQLHCKGKRLKGFMGSLQFCAPRSFKVTRGVGEHGDVHYAVTLRRHGQAFELSIVSGLYFTGKLPDGCAPRRWVSPESKGEECRAIEGNRRSRYITLNAPMGSAQYENVPEEVASQFDSVLDSLCWEALSKGVGTKKGKR